MGAWEIGDPGQWHLGCRGGNVMVQPILEIVCSPWKSFGPGRVPSSLVLALLAFVASRTSVCPLEMCHLLGAGLPMVVSEPSPLPCWCQDACG